jgi:hypothetical protein
MNFAGWVRMIPVWTPFGRPLHGKRNEVGRVFRHDRAAAAFRIAASLGKELMLALPERQHPIGLLSVPENGTDHLPHIGAIDQHGATASRAISEHDQTMTEGTEAFKRRLAGTLSVRRFANAIGDLEALDLDRYPTLTLMRRAFDLRANVSAYDATYVALAEVLRCELLTGDRRLAGSPGVRCTIRVLQ